MNCNRVSKLASSYVDRELTGGEMLAVRDHLGRCPECAAEVEAVASIKKALGEMPTVAMPQGLEGRLKASLRREQEPVLARPSTVTGMVAAAAALACAVAVWQSQTISEAPRQAPVASVENLADQTYVSATDPFGAPVPVFPASFAGN